MDIHMKKLWYWYVFQELDGEEARLVDYFDVVAGTSTGGLLALMVAAPDQNNRPLFAAKDLAKFYLDHAPKIFPQKWVSHACFGKAFVGYKIHMY